MSQATVDLPEEPQTHGPDVAGEQKQIGFLQSWIARISDRANPILVRELHQAIRSRMFQGTLLLSLTTIVIIALVVAVNVGNAPVRDSFGKHAYLATVICLTPLVMLVVPLSAFNSMRHEVLDGALDHLLMTRLRPGEIIRGKLYATLVQFVLYLSVFAPVLALTYLLRGVDVPRIILTLAFALLLCIGATTAGIMLGAVSRWKSIGSLLFSLGSVALVMATFGMMGGADELQRELGRVARGQDLEEVSMFILAVVSGTVLCAMTAGSILTHPYENRSTQFRIFALVLAPIGFITLMICVRSSQLDEALPAYSGIAAAVMFLFWLFAATEQSKLSPRVKTMVPKRRWLAILSIPFLPGSGRGMLFVWVMAAVYMVPGVVLPLLFGRYPDEWPTFVSCLGWMYILFFVGLLSWLRGRVPQTIRFNWITRSMIVVLLAICCFVPLLIDLLLRGRVGDWNYLHLLNPFFTMGGLWPWRRLITPLIVMSVMAGFMIVLNLPAIRAGILEVLAESRKRREREA